MNALAVEREISAKNTHADDPEEIRRRSFNAANRILNNQSDAEDAAQQAFVNLLEKGDQIRAGSAWYYAVRAARCRAIDIIRDRNRHLKTPVDDVLDLKSKDPLGDPLTATLASDLAEKLRKVIGGIPEPYQTVARLRYLEGLRPIEISEELNIKRGTVASRLSRANQQIKTALSRQDLE